MIILTIRTDKPLAELYLYKDHQLLGELRWQAHLELSKTINLQIKKLLNKSSISLKDVEGVVCFAGPGSFTGLRIGLSVANALAYANGMAVIAKSGDNWLKDSISDLLAGKDDKIAVPYYDRPAATSAQIT